MKRETATAYVLVIAVILVTGYNAFKTYQELGQEQEGYTYEDADYTANSTANITMIDEFANLPKPPKDLEDVKLALKEQKPIDLCQLEEEYWLSPKFYPNYKNATPPEGYHGVYGYGIFPSEMDIYTARGEQFEICVFVKAGWGVDTYQGVLFVLPNNTTYLNLSAEPRIFLLEPSYPVFSREWVKRVKIFINVSENAPSGEYNFTASLSYPPFRYRQIWATEYKQRYVDAAAGGITTSEPPLRVRVWIE